MFTFNKIISDICAMANFHTIHKQNRYVFTGLVLALVLPVLVPLVFTYFLKAPFSRNTDINFILREGVMWFLLLAVLVNVKYGEQKPLVLPGLEQKWYQTLGFSALVIIGMVLSGIIFSILVALITHKLPEHENLMSMVRQYPVWKKLIICIRAGIMEEICFRAYGISRLRQLTGNENLSITIPVVLFGLGHSAYGTVNHVLAATVLGIVLTIFYLKTKNLLANMIGHAAFDFISLMLPGG